MATIPNDISKFIFTDEQPRVNTINLPDSPFIVQKDNRLAFDESYGDNSNPFAYQYHHIYIKRLQALKDFYRESFKGQGEVIHDLIDVNKNYDTDIYVVGLVHKKMVKLPSYLKEREKSAYQELVYHEKKELYTSNDIVMIEDETAKLVLGSTDNIRTNIDLGETFGLDIFTTGCVICAKGQINEQSVFIVREVVFCSNIENKMYSQPYSTTNEANYCALLAGFNISHRSEQLISYETLHNFLCNQNNNLTTRISTLLLFGGIVNELEDINTTHYGSYMYKSESEALGTNISKYVTYVDKLLDGFLGEEQFKSKRVAIVVPGLNDPTDSMLPQNPLSNILFPRYKNTLRISFCKHPYTLEIKKGETIVVLDGLIIEDFRRQSKLNFYETAKLILATRNWAPTSPNTLEVFPFTSKDPLVIRTLPDALVVSGAPDFKLDELVINDNHKSRVKLVFVPNFDKSRKIVLADFDSWRFEVVNFGEF